MNPQARRKQRANAPEHKLIGHGLREIVLLLFCVVALYLFVSLFTYYPADPGWSHSGSVDEVHNKGGIAGAWLADVMFYLFGYIAFLFPIIISYMGFLVYQKRHQTLMEDPRALVIPGIGIVLTLSAGCGLAIVHFAAEGMLLPSYAGGVLGMAVGKSLQNIFSNLGATLLLVALFFTGITLLTGLSWFRLMDVLGAQTLRLLPVLEDYLLNHILPWLNLHLKQLSRGLGNALQNLFRQIQDNILILWDEWQAKRAEKTGYIKTYDELQSDESSRDDIFDSPATTASTPASEPLITLRAKSATTARPTRRSLSDALSSPVQQAPFDDLSETLPQTQSSLLPALSLLSAPTPRLVTVDTNALNENIEAAIQAAGFDGSVSNLIPGPLLTTANITLTQPVTNFTDLQTHLVQQLKTEQVTLHQDDDQQLRLEIVNPQRQPIQFSALINDPAWQQQTLVLPLGLGRDIHGQPVIADLARISHLLVVTPDMEERAQLLRVLIISLLYKATADDMRLLLLDDSEHTLGTYDDLPHLLMPIQNAAETHLAALNWCHQEMERRYHLMADAGVRSINDYNAALLDTDNSLMVNVTDRQNMPLPRIVIIISEAAELLLSDDTAAQTEALLIQFTRKARAAGIHLLLITRHAARNVLRESVKGSFSNRLACRLQNISESRLVIGQMGAESLLGQGDMFYLTAGTGAPVRVHSPQITMAEAARVINELAEQPTPEFIELDIDGV